MANLHCEAIAFPSSDGKHTSSAFLYTVPGQPVRAVLQLSHGMCEYVRRYAPLAEFYAAHGIALAGNAHLGHGDTAQTATAWAAFTRAGTLRSGRKVSRRWSFPARQAPAL